MLTAMTFPSAGPPRAGLAQQAVRIGTGLMIAVLAVLFCGSRAAHPAFGTGGPGGLVHFLLAVALVLAVCQVMGRLATLVRQPPVVGEIVGGLLLGPSLLGLVWPAGQAWLFTSPVLDELNVVAELGLIAFLFIIGTELRTVPVSGGARATSRHLAILFAGATVLPLLGGTAVAGPLRGVLAPATAPTAAYVLFLGVALSITALPVLARILTHANLTETRIGVLSLTAAGFGDATAWGVLAVVLAIAGRSGNGTTAAILTLAAALVLVAMLCVRPLCALLVRWGDAAPGREAPVLALLVTGAFAFAAATQFIGLGAIIGGFLFGTIVPPGSAAVARAVFRLRDFVVIVLLPLFFFGVGLHTSVGLLGDSVVRWLTLLAVITVASATKFFGAGVAGRLIGLRGGEAWRLGALMNCRGVTELVVAALGWQSHLINNTGLTVLVLVALGTTMATGPLLRHFARPDADRPAAEDIRAEPLEAPAPPVPVVGE